MSLLRSEETFVARILLEKQEVGFLSHREIIEAYDARDCHVGFESWTAMI